MPQEGLAIIESKSKVRYSRSRASDSRVSTDAPLSNSSPSNNSFDMQQIAASLEDKMTIKMKQMMNEMKALVVTTPAPVKAVEEVCVTCGSNHNFNHCPLTRGGNDFPVFHDNIQQFQQTAAIGNFLQRNQPSNLASQMKPPGFNQPNVQNNQGNQNRYSNQNRGGNFNQNHQNNQGAVYQAPPYQPPMNQPPVYQAPTQQIQGVSKTDFENYVKANDAVLKNVQNQGTLPSQTVTNPREQINAITTRSGKTLEGPSTPLVPTPDVSIPSKEPEQNPKTLTEKVQKPSSESTAQVPPPEDQDSIFIEIPKPKAKKTVNVEIQEPNSPRPTSYQPKLPYPERMKVRENDKPSAQHSRFLKMFKQLRLEIGLKDALQMPKVQPNDDPFSGSTTTHSDDPSPSSSSVKTSDNLEEFVDQLTLLKKDIQEGNFQDHSNPLFEFDDNFKSSTINPLFDEMEEDVEIKNSNIFDEPVLLNTPLSDKVECFAPEDNNDEIDAFLAMEVSSNFEEGYFDSEGDVTFLDNLLSDDASHNLASEVISDHEPEQNESSITFSPRNDPLHHEFAGELLTLPSRNDREFGEYLSLMTVLCEISTSQSQENVHANQNDLIPPGVENDDFENEDNELPNLDHQDNPSIPRPPPEPLDVEKCVEPETGTDISKITRKPSKTGKHGHGKRESTKEAKDSKPKPRKVNSQEKLVISKALISSLSSNATLDLVKAQRDWKFVLATHSEEAQAVTSKE
ncbi:hypothetical protein Tco_0053765 [Tanacetum coccineum]